MTAGPVPEKVDPEAVRDRPAGDDEKDQTGDVSLVESVPVMAAPCRTFDDARLADAVSLAIVIEKTEVVAVVPSKASVAVAVILERLHDPVA